MPKKNRRGRRRGHGPQQTQTANPSGNGSTANGFSCFFFVCFVMFCRSLSVLATPLPPPTTTCGAAPGPPAHPPTFVGPLLPILPLPPRLLPLQTRRAQILSNMSDFLGAAAFHQPFHIPPEQIFHPIPLQRGKRRATKCGNSCFWEDVLPPVSLSFRHP